jgi:hypothetical protein
VLLQKTPLRIAFLGILKAREMQSKVPQHSSLVLFLPYQEEQHVQQEINH